MKAAEALIAWTPVGDEFHSDTVGMVKVGPLGPPPHWSDPYAYTGGAAYVRRRKMPYVEQTAWVFLDFNTLVVRDGIDPQVAHKEFLKIDEYRWALPPDIQGSEDRPEGVEGDFDVV